ncbi:MAG: diacylglycerol/lipid kinase family protein [Actinomycetota bacterium]
MSPFGDLVVIANPHSGRGRVGKEMPELERQLNSKRFGYRIVETEGPGHGTEVAREALRGGERFLVAVGGDGTVQEVVNGMIEDGKPVAEGAVLGVIPAGSGCDFVRTFGLPQEVPKAVRHLEGDRLYPIDIARLDYQEDGKTVTRYIPNIAECGLGGAVVARAERLPRWLGRSRYFWAFWLSVRKFKPARITVKADLKEFEGRANNVVVANCQYYGGGMKISPRSYPGDGVLDIQISTGPKSEAFTMIPKIYRGEHLPHPHIKEMRGRSITVDADRPLPIEGDGEVLGTTPATFTVIPEAVSLKI